MRTPLIALASLLCLTACRGPQMAGIPLGHWAGEGEFVATAAEATATAPTAAESSLAVPIARRYPTTLDIRPGTGPAAGRVVFEIESMRGEIGTLHGDRTHLLFELEPEPQQSLNDGRVQLFRVARAGLSTDESAPTLESDSESNHYVAAIRQDGDLTLHVIYNNEWRDIFVFRGGWLLKSGQYEADPTVYWSETLSRH